jgi:KaiC/GvpD/RAD55 family RecA-like ATPase
LAILLDRVPTGIKGLDELLGGGFPEGRCILITGSPGSGKTTFALQYLYHGAMLGDTGLYVTLDEHPDLVKRNLQSYEWDLEGMEKKGKLLFIDASGLRRTKTSENSLASTYSSPVDVADFSELLKTINKIVDGENVHRIALDPITTLMLRYAEVLKRRRATVAFFDALADSGCTSLITSELKTSLMDRRFQLEEFLSHGVVLLHSLFHEGNIVRAVQIEKMRGISHDTQIRPYQFGTTGIEVFPRDKVF